MDFNAIKQLNRNVVYGADQNFTELYSNMAWPDGVHNLDDYNGEWFVGRYYVIPQESGKKLYYPSATTVLGRISEMNGENGWLEQWRKRVGDAEADRISEEARTRGTIMHEYCENYLLNNDVKNTHLLAWQLFQAIRPYLDQIDNITCLEHAVFNPDLRIAGRVDCIGEYNNIGVQCLIDFKTSRKEKGVALTKEQIKILRDVMTNKLPKDTDLPMVDPTGIIGYAKQISMYAMAYEYMFGIRIDFGYILMGCDTMTTTQTPGGKGFEIMLDPFKSLIIDDLVKMWEHEGYPLEMTADELKAKYIN